MTRDPRVIPLPATIAPPTQIPTQYKQLSSQDSALLAGLVDHLTQCGVLGSKSQDEDWNKVSPEGVALFIEEAAASARPEEFIRPGAYDERLNHYMDSLAYDEVRGNPRFWDDDESSPVDK